MALPVGLYLSESFILNLTVLPTMIYVSAKSQYNDDWRYVHHNIDIEMLSAFIYNFLFLSALLHTCFSLDE